MPPVAIAAVGLGIAAGGTLYSAYQTKKANKANQQAAALDRQRMNLQNARERRDAIKASRQAYAQSQTTAANQGALDTSSAQGALGSITSQGNTNLSFLDRFNVLTDQASEAVGRANTYSANAQVGGQVAGLGWTMFSNSKTISKVWR